MASFQKLLEEKREDNLGESDRVAIAEAGVQYSSDVQGRIDREYKKQPSSERSTKTKFENISSAVVGLPEQLRTDISQLEDGSYQDLIKFIRKYERVRNEVGDKKAFYNDDESDYIENTIAPVLLKIAELKGPVARAAFAFEDFKSQFKPLKLADRFLGDLPIIGNMIRERLDAKNEADKLAKSTGLRARKEKLKENRKQKQSPGSGSVSSGADTFSNISTPMEEMSSSPIVSKSSGGMFGGSEESQKEQLNREEEKMDLFRVIADATMQTQFGVEQLLEAYKDENEGVGELLDTGKGVAMGAGGAAAGAGGLFGLKKLKDKFFGNKKGATKAASKGTAKIAGKTAIKSLIKKIPIIGLGAGLLFGAQRLMAGDITGAGMEVASGAASMVPGAGTALSVATDAGLAARDMANTNKEIDDTVQQATTEAIADTKGQSVALDQVYQINADQVTLKANSMKQLQNENEVIRRDMTTGQGNMQNNTVLNQVTNTAKSQFLGPNLHSTNPRNVIKSIF
jgi:hypothetical protein